MGFVEDFCPRPGCFRVEWRENAVLVESRSLVLDHETPFFEVRPWGETLPCRLAKHGGGLGGAAWPVFVEGAFADGNPNEPAPLAVPCCFARLTGGNLTRHFTANGISPFPNRAFRSPLLRRRSRRTFRRFRRRLGGVALCRLLLAELHRERLHLGHGRHHARAYYGHHFLLHGGLLV